MLKSVYKLLPVFIVAWLARNRCEKIQVGKKTWVTAFDDVLILAKSEVEK